MKRNKLLSFLWALSLFFTLSAQETEEWDSLEVIEMSEIVVQSLNLEDLELYKHRGLKKRSNHSYLINKLFSILTKVQIPEAYQGKQLMAFEIFLVNNYSKCQKESFYLTPFLFSSKDGKPDERLDLIYPTVKVKAGYKGKLIFPLNKHELILNSDEIFLGFRYFNEELPSQEKIQEFREENKSFECANSIKLYNSDTRFYYVNSDKASDTQISKNNLKTLKLNLYFKK